MQVAVGDRVAGGFERGADKNRQLPGGCGRRPRSHCSVPLCESRGALGCRSVLAVHQSGVANPVCARRMLRLNSGDLKEFAAANFKMSPSAFLRETYDPISYQIDGVWIKNKWLACIAEWEADAATASEWTAHFHHRYQRRQPTAPRKAEVKRAVVVSLLKHLCPGTRVKATGVAMQGNQMIPARVANGIANSHFQRFLVCLRLYYGILAGKGRGFDGLYCVWMESFQKILSRRILPHRPLR